MKGILGRFFNRTLISEGFRQTKWIGTALILLSGLNLIAEETSENGISIFVLKYIIYIVVALLVFVLMGFLQKRSGSDVYHMLPVKRHTNILSYGLVAFVWTALAVVINLSGDFVIQYLRNHNIAFYDYFMQMVALLAGLVLIIGISMFSMAVSGNVLAAAIVAIAIIFVPLIVAGGYVELFYSLCPHLVKGSVAEAIMSINNPATVNGITVTPSNILAVLADSENIAMVDNPLYDVSLGTVIFNAIAGVIFNIIACVVYKRRKSEVARKTGLSKGFSLFIKIMVSMALSIYSIRVIPEELIQISSSIIYVNPGLFVIGNLALIAIVWYLLEFFTTKSIKKAFKSFLQLPLILVVNILILTFYVVSADISSAKVPETKDIESIRICSGFEYVGYSQNEKGREIEASGDVLAQVEIKDSETIEFFRNMLASDMESYRRGRGIKQDPQPIIVEFITDSGKIRRNLHLDILEVFEATDYLYAAAHETFDYEYPLTEYISRNGSSVLKIQTDGYGMKIGAGEKVTLFNCLYEELKGLNMPLSYYLGNVYDKEDAFCYVIKSEEWGKFYLPVSKDTPKTLELLMSLTNIGVNETYFDYDEDINFRGSKELQVLILPKDAESIKAATYVYKGEDTERYNKELKVIHDSLASGTDYVDFNENVLLVNYIHYDQYQASTWVNVSDEVVEKILNLSGFATEN